MKQTFLLMILGLCACSGSAGELDAGPTPFDAGLDAGLPIIVYPQFTVVGGGWPVNALARGAAVLDGVIYVATDRGLFSLASTSSTWSPEIVPLTHDDPPSSLQRSGQTLVMTAAGVATGGLFIKPYDGAWQQVTSAPTAPCWSLTQRGQWLLATSQGLYAAATLDGPWVLRSSPAEPLFQAPLTHFLAAPGQQKVFAAGTFDAGLFQSNDDGASWSLALDGGVQGLTGSGPVVLVTTTQGVLRSDNYGNTFKPGPTLAGEVRQLAINGSTWWAATSLGLSTSTDAALTFASSTSTDTQGVFFAGGTIVAITPAGPALYQP